MQWRRLARFKASSSGGSTRARNMLCCGRRKENGRSVPDLTASPGRAPPPTRLKDQTPMVIQSDFRKVSGISSEIFRQIETVENDHDATTAAALEAVERRGEMIVRILEPRQVGRAANEAAKRFFSLQDARHTVQLVEIVKRPGQTLGLYIREGNGMDRTDGVFISRIALESAVYNSGCLKVGDEILAVNLVDVTHMSLDDVVIIMSIPRRLVLATRQRKGNKGSGSPSMQAIADHKANPVVVIKRELRDEDLDRVDEMDRGHGNNDYRENSMRDSGRMRHGGDGREMTESRSRLGLGLAGYSPDQSSNMDLYYNSRPPTETPTNHWSYQPPPPVITEQPKSNSAQHFQGYDRGYPKTLESLAEKVHSFYTGPVLPRRLSAGGQPMTSARFSSNQRIMPRSGSDQHLPRVEYSDYTSISPAGRHTLLRSSLKSGSTLSRYNQRYGTTGPDSRAMTNKYMPSNSISSQGTLTRRNRSLDYSSDTEATCGPSSRSNYYYYNRSEQPSSVINSMSRTNTILGTDFINKFNSLPRDTRSSTRLAVGKRFGTLDRPGGIASLLMDDADGNISAPEMPHLSARGTRDEYRSWLSRTPSTSAIYEQIRASRDVLNQHRAARFTYSAENIHDALKNAENAAAFSSSYGLYSGGRSALTGTLDRNLIGRTAGSSIPARSLSTQHITTAGAPCILGGMIGSPSTRRMRQLLELGSRGGPSPVPTPSSSTLPRSRHIDINPAEFLKYKMDKSSMATSSSVSMGLSNSGVSSPGVQGTGVSGMLWLHLLAGRGLRGEGSTTPTGPHYPRDLYCVLECDRVHKARTVVRTGDLQFDWDESFELDLVKNRQLDLLVYSWDPQHRHKLCYRGALNLAQLLAQSPLHQLALKIEPRGTIYLRLRYTDSVQLYRRRPISAPVSRSTPPLFGAELDVVVNREISRQGPQAGSQPPIPLIIRRCVEEIERRGLDIIGLYRLCGSATKKRILRESFERNSRTVELTPDNVPDINVITGVLKDYLRELPQPLFTKCLYQMTVDALGVCLPDDPEGNAKLMFSILDCLPRSNRATLIFLLDHLAMVVSVSDRNKMSPENLATALAPPLMLHSSGETHSHLTELDYAQPIGVLKYLLQIWPAPKHSVRRGEPAHGPHGNRASASPVGHSTLPGPYQPSASPYLPAAVVSAASPAPLARPSLAPSQVGHAQLSAKVGQYRPQSPRTGPLPVPPRSRQVIVSSPGSPSSSSDSQSGNDTLKHGGSVSSIVRQPQSQPQSSSRASPALSQDAPAPPRPPSASSISQPLHYYSSSPSTTMFTNGHGKSPRESPSLHRVSSPAHRTASPGIPGTNAGIAVTMNSSPFLTDLTTTSLTTMENTLISNLQSTINNIGTTTESIYHHTTSDNIGGIKSQDLVNTKSLIYGQKMAPVNSTAVSTVVPSYATYGSRQTENVFDTIGTIKQTNLNFNSQSDIFGTGPNSSMKISSGYDLINYSSTNPFLQNYSTDTIQEENIGDVTFSSNLFTSRSSGNTEAPGLYKREELTPSSSAGTEDSRHLRRDMQDKDVEGDVEESD